MKDCTAYFDLFKSYHDKNLAWGSLHIVLDDGNIDNASVEFCIKNAEQQGDEDGLKLGKLLLEMTKSQRGKIAKLC